MIKYRTINTANEIFQVEIEKETEHQIVFNGRRSNKMSDYDCFFNTFEEAKQYLISTVSQEIKNLRDRLNREQDKLNKIMSIEMSSNDKGV